MLSLAACGNGDSPADVEADAPAFFSIGTGGTGGTAYPVGGAYAGILTSNVEGTTFTAEATGGSVENVRLIGEGEIDMGQIQADTASQGCNGEGVFEDAIPITTYAVLYPNTLAYVRLANSGIESLEDAKGTALSVGDQGSGTDLAAQAVLEANGMSYSDFDINYLSLADQATAFRDRQISSAFWSPPRLGAQSSLIDLSSDQAIDWRGFTDEEMENAAAEHPYYTPGVIPAETYNNQPEDFPVLLIWHTYQGRADLPEDFVYEVTKQLIEHAEVVSAQQVALGDFDVDNIQYAPCPIHPGAARAYQEAGATVPDELIADGA
ncbi:TAXI family TRAP transporter solute-binding subunit [Ornithinimicrobium sp. Y1847]|uniref:TAXI family TRAP transporter solute-binding subunit n=1 Tax=Ornithinimicrobium sp. Y1847 TaxID=3405419 RepID=UPI003D01C77E